MQCRELLTFIPALELNLTPDRFRGLWFSTLTDYLLARVVFGVLLVEVKLWYGMVIAKNHTERVILFSGDYYGTDKSDRISTLLGSCVSACLYESVNGRGGHEPLSPEQQALYG